MAQYLATQAAPDREKLAAKLAKLSGTRVDASDAASLTKAFRQAALRHHPDKAGDACVFDECVQTYRRLVDGVPGNPYEIRRRLGHCSARPRRSSRASRRNCLWSCLSSRPGSLWGR